MEVQTKTLYGVIALLLAAVIIVSSFAGLYYYQYSKEASANSVYVQELSKSGVRFASDIVIDYGNGTHTWYNETAVLPGSNLYTLTVLVTEGNVNATCCEYGSHFVTGISGIQNTNAKSWFLWTYNSTASWQTAQSGPDEYSIFNESVFAWTFCGMTASYNPSCTPP
ncbi:MAG: hypothetical protein ACREBS_08735 [Nitrososphaerales archaeon]